jgi:glycosyltransferase involved in cell wall biosynthesis
LKIAVDPWTLASRFRCQGTYVYAQHLIREFKKIAKVDPELSFCLFASQATRNDAVQIEPEESFNIEPAPMLRHDRLWRLSGVNMAAARIHADLLFAPTPAMLPIGLVPVVCTIHDVTAVKMPSHSARVTRLMRFVLWSSARFSRSLITDSHYSKEDIVNTYGVPEGKVSVVYLGYDKAVFNSDPADSAAHNSLMKRLGIDKPYVLHHGTIQPRKNLKRLIAAYKLMLARDRNLDLDLILAGRLGWDYEAIVAAGSNHGGGRGRVAFPGMLSDADLALLIKGASLVVIPSLYEGFCLPLVEAMACGTPAVVSNTSCLPEISGNALAYFDPCSVDEIAVQMGSVLLDRERSAQLRELGLERACTFSWERCARETLCVLRDAVSGRPAKS